MARQSREDCGVEQLASVHCAKQFRDEHMYGGVSAKDVLNAILAAPSRREQLAILSIVGHTWNGDEGYGCVPSDNDAFCGYRL